MDNNEKIKRRLNFISGEDFYFLTYEVMILLDVLTTANGEFKDHRKLAYLIEIISNSNVINVLMRYKGKHVNNAHDKELLFSTFINGEIHEREIFKLILAFDKKGYVTINRSVHTEVLNIKLRRENLPAQFLINDVFMKDRKNAVILKQLVKRLSVLSFETFITKIYKEYGIQAWAL